MHYNNGEEDDHSPVKSKQDEERQTIPLARGRLPFSLGHQRPHTGKGAVVGTHMLLLGLNAVREVVMDRVWEDGARITQAPM